MSELHLGFQASSNMLHMQSQVAQLIPVIFQDVLACFSLSQLPVSFSLLNPEASNPKPYKPNKSTF